MLILGYSGFDNSTQYRKKEFPSLSGGLEGFCQGLDAAAVLIEDGKIIAAAEEERFIGEKHTCRFPINSINFCLAKRNITIKDINYICHGFDYSLIADLYELSDLSKKYYDHVLAPELQMKIFKDHFPNFKESQFVPIQHHTTHAASAFFPSKFKDALILITDGLGELESISLYLGSGNKLELLDSSDIFSSLGILYALITYHLGFEPGADEYKVMGLAPYGDPNKFKAFFEENVKLGPEGRIYIPLFELNKGVEKYTYEGVTKYLEKNLCPYRKKDSKTTQMHMDIAAALQHSLNEAILHIVRYWKEKTSSKNLCIAGGVGFNCTANGFLLSKNLFDNIYVQPAAGDAGTALGAALYQYCVTLGKAFDSSQIDMPYYGPSYDNSQIEKVLNKYSDKIKYQYLEQNDLLEAAAQMIADGKIIAWVQNEMEFGPRALGNRSILADPRRADMRDRINKIVKKREQFRPFAPSAKIEKAHLYFEFPEAANLAHMLFIVPVKAEYAQKLPAITHVDNSARVQTVDKKDNFLYWSLIDKVEKRTGIGVVLNTSYNVKGQAIVCTPDEAISTFIKIELDALFIGNYLVLK